MRDPHDDEDLPIAEQTLEPRCLQLLAEEHGRILEERAHAWPGFQRRVLEQIQALEPIEDPSTSAAIQAELEQACDERASEWQAFTQAVLARCEAEQMIALPAPVVAALTTERDVELKSRAQDWPSFSRAVFGQIEREVEEELEGEDLVLGRALEADTQAALAGQDFGQFERQVAPPEPLEVEAFKRELAFELRVMDGKFEGPFKRSVERRLPRRWLSLRPPRRDRGWRHSGAALGAALVALLLLMMLGPDALEDSVEDELWGDVAVESIDFDGTVTVTQDSGVAVIWLSEPPS